MMHLITGYAGYGHIKSEDDGAFNAAFFGDGQFVMESGNQFSATVIDNNTVRISDGDGMMFGRHFRIKPNTYEEAVITTGTAGVSRYDIICVTYKKNETDGTESAYVEVIKGAEAKTPVLPSYTTGNIIDGAVFNQMPLYKVLINGISLTEIQPMFATQPTYKALAERYKKEFVQACETHLNSLNVLDSAEEVITNTQNNQLTGALAVREIYQHMINTVISKSNFEFDAETGTLNLTL